MRDKACSCYCHNHPNKYEETSFKHDLPPLLIFSSAE
jgi:hypothetical protein